MIDIYENDYCIALDVTSITIEYNIVLLILYILCRFQYKLNDIMFFFLILFNFLSWFDSIHFNIIAHDCAHVHFSSFVDHNSQFVISFFIYFIFYIISIFNWNEEIHAWDEEFVINYISHVILFKIVVYRSNNFYHFIIIISKYKFYSDCWLLNVKWNSPPATICMGGRTSYSLPTITVALVFYYSLLLLLLLLSWRLVIIFHEHPNNFLLRCNGTRYDFFSFSVNHR